MIISIIVKDLSADYSNQDSLLQSLQQISGRIAPFSKYPYIIFSRTSK